MKQPDYYAILGVARSAPPEVIQGAYRALIKKCHPDRSRGDGLKEFEAKVLGEAYAVLSDPERRAKYDREHPVAAAPAAAAQAVEEAPARDPADDETVKAVAGLSANAGSLFAKLLGKTALGQRAAAAAKVMGVEDPHERVAQGAAYVGARATIAAQDAVRRETERKAALLKKDGGE